MMILNITIYDFLMLLGVPSLVTLAIVWLVEKFSKRRREKRDNDKLIQQSLQALLRDRLRYQYCKYVKRGWMDIDDKNNYVNMYERYHALGENGVMDRMYDEILQLPTSPPPGWQEKC